DPVASDPIARTRLRGAYCYRTQPTLDFPLMRSSRASTDDKDLYTGLIRLHVLHHAVVEGPVYGLWMIEELARHGYRLSPGTLYPILHGLERKGYLRATEERDGRRS